MTTRLLQDVGGCECLWKSVDAVFRNEAADARIRSLGDLDDVAFVVAGDDLHRRFVIDALAREALADSARELSDGPRLLQIRELIVGLAVGINRDGGISRRRDQIMPASREHYGDADR